MLAVEKIINDVINFKEPILVYVNKTNVYTSEQRINGVLDFREQKFVYVNKKNVYTNDSFPTPNPSSRGYEC